MKSSLRKSFDYCFGNLPLSLSRQAFPQRLLVPCYHLVSDAAPPHVKHLLCCRTAEQFQQDLELLLRHFQPISVDDLWDHVDRGRRLPRFPMLLTVDDGFREAAEVIAPICRARGVPAAFYVTTSFVENAELGYRNKASVLVEWLQASTGLDHPELLELLQIEGQGCDPRAALLQVEYADAARLDRVAEFLGIRWTEYLRDYQPYMTWNDVRELVRQGFHVGAHSVDHPHYAACPIDVQLEQTRRSVCELQQHVTQNIDTFAMPFTADGVAGEFYQRLFESDLVQLLFCIGAVAWRPDKRIVGRFCPENHGGAPASRVLRDLYGGYWRTTAHRLWQTAK